MHHVGIDVHKCESQVCVLNADGSVVREVRIRTEPGRFAAALQDLGKARVLIEACGESDWVARTIEELGHEVIVAHPGYKPMYVMADRRVKTDRRDARSLAEACRVGAFRRAHRASDRSKAVRARLAVRECLVRTRAKFVVLAQALVRRTGLRVPSGSAEKFGERLAKMELPDDLRLQLAPMLALLEPLKAQIDALDAELEAEAKKDDSARLLMSVPGVGPITALTFAAVIDDPKRFAGAHQLEAYLGLVPREYSSGERKVRGAITKAGDERGRRLLVQTALRMRRFARTDALVQWSDRIAARRGKKTAVVALARRLAGIMYAMLRDGTTYERAPPSVAA